MFLQSIRLWKRTSKTTLTLNLSLSLAPLLTPNRTPRKKINNTSLHEPVSKSENPRVSQRCGRSLAQDVGLQHLVIATVQEDGPGVLAVLRAEDGPVDARIPREALCSTDPPGRGPNGVNHACGASTAVVLFGNPIWSTGGQAPEAPWIKRKKLCPDDPNFTMQVMPK